MASLSQVVVLRTFFSWFLGASGSLTAEIATHISHDWFKPSTDQELSTKEAGKSKLHK